MRTSCSYNSWQKEKEPLGKDKAQKETSPSQLPTLGVTNPGGEEDPPDANLGNVKTQFNPETYIGLQTQSLFR